MISKELLREVLKDKLKEEYNGSYDFICNGVVNLERNEVSSTLGFYDSELDFFINIYELAHKCKEWALSKDYYLRAEQGINYYDNLQWTCFLNINMDDGAEYIDYWNSTEPEAIFKACQWILNNKDRK